MAKVNVYDGERIVARVKYNELLDSWDGNDYSSGSTGHHLGITKLKSGKFVLIYGTAWEGERNTASVVSDEEALFAVLESGHDELLDQPKYARLKALSDKMDGEEE